MSRCCVRGWNERYKGEIKFIHSADWQLGKPFGRSDPDVRWALVEARFDAVDALGRAAGEHVIVAGDISDREGPEDRTISRMDRHACPWWLLSGNHDFAGNGGLWDRLRQRTSDKLIMLSEPEPREIKGKIWLLPAPLIHRHNLQDPTSLFDAMETPGARLRIGVAHGSASGPEFRYDPSTSAPSAPRRRGQCRLRAA